MGNHAWKCILGGKPLSWWKDVTWALKEQEINFDALSQASRRIVNDMLDGHVNGVPNIYGRWPESKVRPRRGAHEQDIGGVDLQKLLLRMLAAALRRHTQEGDRSQDRSARAALHHGGHTP
jgi:hypothetical protein